MPFPFELRCTVVKLRFGLADSILLFSCQQRGEGWIAAQCFKIFNQLIRRHGVRCIGLLHAPVVQIEQLHRVLIELIAHSSEQARHLLRREFLVVYHGIGDDLGLIQRFLCRIIKHCGIFRIRQNIFRQEGNKFIQRHGLIRCVFHTVAEHKELRDLPLIHTETLRQNGGRQGCAQRLLIG